MAVTEAPSLDALAAAVDCDTAETSGDLGRTHPMDCRCRCCAREEAGE